MRAGRAVAAAAALVALAACQRAETPWESDAATRSAAAAADTAAATHTPTQPTLTVDDEWAAVNRHSY